MTLPVTFAQPNAVTLLVLRSLGNSIFKYWPDVVIVLVSAGREPFTKLTFNVPLLTETDAIDADMTTLPVEELTCMPAPGVLFTELTAASDVTLYSSLKFVCTFWKAVRIASASGSPGNVPKSMFCCISYYLLSSIYRFWQNTIAEKIARRTELFVTRLLIVRLVLPNLLADQLILSSESMRL